MRISVELPGIRFESPGPTGVLVVSRRHDPLLDKVTRHGTLCLALAVLTALNHCIVARLHLKMSPKGWQEQVRMHAGACSKDWSWPCAFFVPSLRYRYRPDVRQTIRLDVILHQLSPQSCNLATIASVECYVSDIMCAWNDGEREGPGGKDSLCRGRSSSRQEAKKMYRMYVTNESDAKEKATMDSSSLLAVLDTIGILLPPHNCYFKDTDKRVRFVWLARTAGVSAACMHLSRAATYRVKALKISQAIALDAMRLVLNMMMLAK